MIYQLNAGVNNPQDESVAQQKDEATSENNAASNHSSGQLACRQRNNEQIENGSDTQVSVSNLVCKLSNAFIGAWDSINLHKRFELFFSLPFYFIFKYLDIY